MRIFSTLVFPRRQQQQIFNLRQFQTTTIRRNPISIAPIQIPMDAEQSLRQSLSEKSSSVEAQGNAVRALKASRAAKPEIDAAIEQLNRLKLEKSAVEKELQSIISSSGNGSLNREAFRKAVVNTLERRLFYIPSFKIYSGVAGLFDYGPPGCAIKSNVLSFWRQHFILEENMLEVDCPCVTPEVVLKASGHVDKFTDLMVKDEKTGTCYRADHLLKDYCTDKLEKDLTISAEKAAELKDVLAVMEDFSPEQLGAKIKEYGITAPDTKNPLSDPYPFNLMFQTSIGPSGLIPGYMRPETAQGIFVNFKDLYYYNGKKLPFAAAQIGQAFRNEISPRQGLLRVREFTLAEIEHFVDPENKSHPKFSDVAKLEFLMFPREEQMSGQSAKKLCLGEAVSKGTVNNETLGYFIGRVYLFLTRLGIDKERLRFRQHLANEMAHYAADCWDAEIESSYGWIECVGIADREKNKIMSRFHILLTLALAIATVSVVIAQVPPEKQFRVINEGEFGQYITEYDASYRFIESSNQSFFTSPFQLLFYNTTPSAYILGLRVGLRRDESTMRWIWDANRNNPVGENSTLSLGRNGNLVLAEADGRVKWQTNTANKGVTGFRILPNGNMILHDKNGKFVWQSFDHPTDTLLNGQSLKVNGVNKLVSRTSDLNGSDGPYSMVLDNKGLTMYVNKTGTPLVYGGWPDHDFRGTVTFAVTREFDNLTEPSAYELLLEPAPQPATNPGNNRRLLQVRPIGSGGGTLNLNKINYNGTISYLRLGSDGSLKAFSYFPPATYLKWEESFSFFSTYFVRQCGLPSFCGDYGYCDRGMCIACPTPKGLLGWSDKCAPPKTTQFCSGKAVNYYKIVGVEHFTGPYVNDGQGPTSVNDCKAKCDRDCKCLGYFYKEKDKKCLLAPLLGTLIKDANTSSVAYIKY